MHLAPQEFFFLGCALGWVGCAVAFMIIPSWRVRDVRKMTNEELSALADQALGEMQKRSYIESDVADLESCRQLALHVFPPRERRALRRTP